MSTYFTPWRRKLGVLTLVLACLFAVEWVRSGYYAEVFRFRVGTHLHILLSLSSGVGWSHETGLQANSLPLGFHSMSTAYISPLDPFIEEWPEYESQRTECMGFLVIKGVGIIDVKDRFELWFVRHGWPTTLLTLLSAWLLLSKPRVRKLQTESPFQTES